MKASYYNVTVELEQGETLLYNTYWQSMATLDKDEAEAYEALKSGEPDEGFTAFYDELAEKRFLVDDPEREADWLEYEFERYKYNNEMFELIVCPTIDCNFRCPYCYEKKRPGRMDEQTQDALLAFVQESYDEQPFQKMRVTWYGGEPLLEQQIIERLSRGFLDFCDSHGIDYHAALMTNGSLASEDAMRRMEACGVKSVQVTFGGKGKVHDCERPEIHGKSTFDTIYSNVCRMMDEGKTLHVEYVFDRDNIDSCLEVVDDLAGNGNVYTHFPYPKMDYNNDFTDADGNEKFNLQTPRERAESYRDIILRSRPTLGQWRQFMRPIHHYCGCSYDRFFVIDELGNAYKCICDVDKPDTHRLFNINEPAETRSINWKMMSYYMDDNPLNSPTCRSCKVFPLCNGYCYIDRDADRFWVPVRCHPIKMVIDDFVAAYYRSMQEAQQA